MTGGVSSSLLLPSLDYLFVFMKEGTRGDEMSRTIPGWGRS